MRATAPDHARVSVLGCLRYGWPAVLASTSRYRMNGVFRFKRAGVVLRAIASTGEGWEHVSVTVEANRTPTWEEMCFIKDQFWDPAEAVMQLHPPEADCVNFQPNRLHLWKPLGAEIPRPPKELVGGGR